MMPHKWKTSGKKNQVAKKIIVAFYEVRHDLIHVCPAILSYFDGQLWNHKN